MKILIIGGSRFVGPLVVKLLLKNRHNLTIFNRGTIETKYPAGVRYIQGDRDKGFGIKERFDVVIDMCAYTGKQTERVLKELKFDYFLDFSTIAAYKKTELFPITEDYPIGDWPSWGEYNKGKAQCEMVLAKSNIKYASIRPTYILGPKNYCDRENFIYSRIKKSLPLILPGNGLGVVQFVFVDEVAQIIANLAEKKITGNYNVVGDQAITLYGLVQEMAKIVNKKPIIKFNPKAIGDNYKEEEFPFDNENFIASNAKVKKLGFSFRPLVEGLRKDYKNFYKDTI
jgi:nucleoside-diphosphate-sugar epimerase